MAAAAFPRSPRRNYAELDSPDGVGAQSWRAPGSDLSDCRRYALSAGGIPCFFWERTSGSAVNRAGSSELTRPPGEQVLDRLRRWLE